MADLDGMTDADLARLIEQARALIATREQTRAQDAAQLGVSIHAAIDTLTGLLGPVVSSALQDVALVATAFAAVGFIVAKIVLPASRALRASVEAPAAVAALEERFDAFERKLDTLLARHHEDPPG